MFQIAILGCENSHAGAFLDFIAQGLFPEVEAIGVYSDDPEAAQRLKEKFGVPIMQRYDELVGRVDGIMVTARHGDNHLRYARPYLASGIPMFIDKPITVSEEDAVALVREAQQNGVRLCGGSTCAYVEETVELKQYFATLEKGSVIGGNVICPVMLENEYGGFFFYSQHLVQVMVEIFGEDPIAVSAKRRGGNVYATVEYPEFSVCVTFAEDVKYYYAEVFTKSAFVSRKLHIKTESFRHEMKLMDDLLHGKPMEKSYLSFIKPVFILNAIWRSVNEDGARVEIQYPSI
jgi:predicted dehydrogenase